MDIHPTPFPGKQRRSIAKLAAAKEDDTIKASKRPPWQNPTVPKNRPKRTFGTLRNNNTIVEKPPSTKPSLTKNSKVSKPLKPSEATKVASPTSTDPPGPVTVAEKSADRKADAKKAQHVTFQEPEVKCKNSDKVEEDDKEDVACTPMPWKKDVELPTPFFTAQNCSKCRLDDKLESTAYWLDQIKLAESVGKHFVSANFFRLALECHAQPLHRLRGELRYYVARHRLNSNELIWIEVFRDYGMLKEKPHDVSELNFNSIDMSLVEKEKSLQELDEDLCNIEQTGALLVELEDSEPKSHDELLNSEVYEDDCLGHINCDNLPIGKPDEDNKNLTENSADTKDIGGAKLGDNELTVSQLAGKVEDNDNSNTPSTIKLLGSSTGKSKSADAGSNQDSATSKSVSKDSKTPKSGATSGKKQENVPGKKALSGILAKSTTKISRVGSSKDKDLKEGSANKKLNDKKQRSPHISKKDQL